MNVRLVVLVSLLALASCRAADAPSPSSSRTPDAPTPIPTEIAWESFESGLARAQSENKPFVVVFTATWCTQCEAYRSVLSNPQVISASRDLVMIRVDITDHPDLNQRYAYDGTYVPRTMFFGPDGTHRPDLRSASRARYLYFLDPRDPSELLGLMRRALSAG